MDEAHDHGDQVSVVSDENWMYDICIIYQGFFYDFFFAITT